MNADDFAIDLIPGRLEPTSFGERRFAGTSVSIEEVLGVGFVPNRLPPPLNHGDLLVATQEALLSAERNLSRLDGVARDLENPYLLIGPFTTREAKFSSAIENTYASARQIALFDFDPNSI